ncbi:MAG TPA: MarR family transcriptional regulator [Stellaceae bacterium]|nr:MarR family transcriptional regulator [Stellaceae bacterium]
MAKKPPKTATLDRVLSERIYTRPGFLARQLHRITAAIFDDETASFGLTGLQYGILNVVAVEPGIDQIGVCNTLGVDRSTLAGVVDRLEQKGLVARSPGADRRSNALHLTSAGKRILGEMETSAGKAERRAFDIFTPAEQARFEHMLARLVEHHARYAGMPKLARSASKPTPRKRTRKAAR